MNFKRAGVRCSKVLCEESAINVADTLLFYVRSLRCRLCSLQSHHLPNGFKQMDLWAVASIASPYQGQGYSWA